MNRDITTGGIEKIKTEKKKMATKLSEEYFFHQRCNTEADRGQSQNIFEIQKKSTSKKTFQIAIFSFESLLNSLSNLKNYYISKRERSLDFPVP